MHGIWSEPFSILSLCANIWLNSINYMAVFHIDLKASQFKTIRYLPCPYLFWDYTELNTWYTNQCVSCHGWGVHWSIGASQRCGSFGVVICETFWYLTFPGSRRIWLHSVMLHVCHYHVYVFLLKVEINFY